MKIMKINNFLNVAHTYKLSKQIQMLCINEPTWESGTIFAEVDHLLQYVIQ